MATYTIREIYYTLQGEGRQVGRPAVFCRFTGCNLWSGREQDRSTATCRFCDTIFIGTEGENGGKYDAGALADKVQSLWPGSGIPYVVCTGGEPLLQLDKVLIDAFHQRGFDVAIETNGTYDAPPGIDWICMSPKANTEIRLTSGNELKLVYPQPGLDPAFFLNLDYDHFYLQPMDGPQLEENTRKTVEYCLNNPVWRLSLQTHKLLGLK